MNAGDIVTFIAEHYGWIYAVMSVILSLITEGIKIPIKMLTSKIKNDTARKATNKVIILIAFGLAFLIDYLASIWFPDYVVFSSVKSIMVGCFSNTLYALVEGLITKADAKTAVNATSSSAASLENGDSDDAIKKAKEAYDEIVKKNTSK
jgi:hypothetical protein